jgi:hypothetical protein
VNPGGSLFPVQGFPFAVQMLFHISHTPMNPIVPLLYTSGACYICPFWMNPD